MIIFCAEAQGEKISWMFIVRKVEDVTAHSDRDDIIPDGQKPDRPLRLCRVDEHRGGLNRTLGGLNAGGTAVVENDLRRRYVESNLTSMLPNDAGKPFCKSAVPSVKRKRRYGKKRGKMVKRKIEARQSEKIQGLDIEERLEFPAEPVFSRSPSGRTFGKVR